MLLMVVAVLHVPLASGEVVGAVVMPHGEANHMVTAWAHIHVRQSIDVMTRPYHDTFVVQ